MASTDPTLDPALRSWVESANDGIGDFPIQNIPIGIFRRQGTEQAPRASIAIGDRVLDVVACRAAGWFDNHTAAVAAAAYPASSLNGLVALGSAAHRALRQRVSELLRHDSDLGGTAREHAGEILAAQDAVECLFPPGSATSPTFLHRSIMRQMSAACFGRINRCNPTTNTSRSPITGVRRRCR